MYIKEKAMCNEAVHLFEDQISSAFSLLLFILASVLIIKFLFRLACKNTVYGRPLEQTRNLLCLFIDF
jgi:hypothetical protein